MKVTQCLFFSFSFELAASAYFVQIRVYCNSNVDIYFFKSSIFCAHIQAKLAETISASNFKWQL